MTPDGRRVAFVYDPFARRVAKRTVGSGGVVSLTRFVWDADVLVHEIRESAGAGGAPVVERRTYSFRPGTVFPLAPRAPCPNCSELLANLHSKWGGPAPETIQEGYPALTGKKGAKTGMAAELQIEPPRCAPVAPSPEVLLEGGAVALVAGPGEEGTSGHVWAPPGPPRLEQTRLFAGTLLSWETVDGRGARIRDFTGAEDALLPLLTARAVRGLLRLGARVDPRRKGARASLERLLSCWKLPSHEAALDFEERLGGLRFANQQWGPFGIVGAWPDRPAAKEAASVDEGQLVPIGAEILGSVSYAVDAEGTVHLEDEHLEPTPIAVSWPVCLERVGAASADEGELPCSCRMQARVGLVVAAALGAVPVPEGTDQHASMWYRDGISVLDVAADPYDSEPRTTIAARSEGDLVLALQAALQVAPGAAVEVFGVKGDPSPPAPDEPVVVRARLRGDTWDETERELCIYGGPERYRFVWR